jgi:D-alanyl-D-alanine dipeptidase
MSYGHAERNLAAVRVLCAETIRLLANRQVLTPDEKQWLDEATARQGGKRPKPARPRLKSNDSTTPSSHRTGSAVA